MNRRLAGVAAALALVPLAVAAVAATNPAFLITGYDTTTVEAVDDTGESLATVEARVADGFLKQYVGLSATDDLDAGEGMLFVHGDAAERAYVMRDMAFPIDIVFVDTDGTVTTIHEAAPESGSLTRYEGTGKYVLEVPCGWSERHGVDPGDRLVIDRE
ncbi:DUF192 domain-containing protein [Halorubrum sp. SD683]|uniref:DUF192 domain-containing protein n=1 Tax=Halorubrum sp. SD683 TaxID=1855873 RepID=UPI000A2D1E0D|nr:DUF192 domain-containing protein [Halorubrum sp. SD683]OTF01612.1 hypothetical protein B9G49_01925 [Halorubrum sp. SD683]